LPSVNLRVKPLTSYSQQVNFRLKNDNGQWRYLTSFHFPIKDSPLQHNRIFGFTIDSTKYVVENKELREKIFAYLEEEGLEDEKGNIQLPLEAPIDGVLRIEKSGRRTRKLDDEKAAEIIEAAGIADDVYKMVRVIDEDALMASYYEGKVTEEQIDEMFPVTVTWALRTPKK
jgi:hypothetical protein